MVSFFFLYYNLFLFLYLYLYINIIILRVREKIYIGYHIGYNFYTPKCYICACARKFKFAHVRLHQLSCTRTKHLFQQFQNQDKG